MPTKKPFFPNLDGLRFVAFFLVFWQHASEPLRAIYPLDDRFYLTGGAGVSFFFVLSGFLITYLLLDERRSTGGVNVKAFYARRVLRIFPLYYLVVAWGFGVYPFVRYLLGAPPASAGSLPMFLAFLGNFDIMQHSDSSGFVGVLWSVSIEEQFYLAWAILFALLPASWYKYLLLAVVAGSTLFRFAFANDDRVLYFHTLSVISDMAVGGVMAYMAINGQRLVRFFRDLSRSFILLGYLAGLLLWFFPPFGFWLDRLVLTLFFAFVIAEQNWSERSLFKMAGSRWLSRLGVYTYGLYCLHMIALYFVGLGVKGVSGDMAKPGTIAAYMVAGLAVSIALAYLSYEFYESRFLRLKKHFSV
jgi:peptidoglycan/LPS O-acetylase OafA/YrhL